MRWLLLLSLVLLGCETPIRETGRPKLSVMAWNIWHGGREDGEQIGPQRVVEVIRDSGADVVGMQETYGSGRWISGELGFHFHPRGTNVSIHSRYPVIEDVSVFEEFKCVGAIIELPGGSRVAFYSIWLPYDAEIWAAGTREAKAREEVIAACASSAIDLAEILEQIHARLTAGGHADLPVIIAGDFNSMSHLDYIESTREQFGEVIAWKTSRVITAAGFRDAYRSSHPNVNRLRDRTWTPRFPEQQQDRIDFIYDTWPDARVVEARVIDKHDEQFPSDHAALIVRYSQ